MIPNNQLYRVNVSPVNLSSLRSNELNAATLFVESIISVFMKYGDSKQSTASSQCFSGESLIVEE